MEEENKEIKKLKRSRTDVVVAGVFGGMGEYFRVDPVIFRLAGVILFFASGFLPFILAYIIAIVIIPEERTVSDAPIEKPKRNKWLMWLMIIILAFLLISPLLAFLGFRSYADRLQEFAFFGEPYVTDEYHYAERMHSIENILPAPPRSAINKYLEDNMITTSRDGDVFADHHEFGRGEGELFIWAYVAEMYNVEGEIETGTATSLPVVIEFSGNEITGHSIPGDGSHYPEDLANMFPERIYEQILNFQSTHRSTIEALKDETEERARQSL